MAKGRRDQAELLVALGSQGTAALAIAVEIMRALIAKGMLQSDETVALLETAARSAERQSDELGGSYSRSVASTIRQIAAAVGGQEPPPQRH